jgi:hypothetical protein
MKTLLFPQKPLEIPDDYARCAPKGVNGLFISVHQAYNEHHELTIAPDDIYNTICSIWAKYIVINAEKFRSQIVMHEGKKTLIVRVPQNTEWTQELLLYHMDEYIRKIEEDQQSIQWMNAEFSTSTTSDKIIRKIVILASQKEYYAYHSHTLCWLPKINILGNDDDWDLLYSRVQNMPTFDEPMRVWKGKLLNIVEKFQNADETDESFWQSPVYEKGGGSGVMPYYTGWLTVFSPFNEKGIWNYKVETNSILNLEVNFQINCFDDTGTIHTGDLDVSGGPTCDKVTDAGHRPSNHFEMVYTSHTNV